MERENLNPKEVSQEARAVLCEIAQKGVAEFAQISSLIMETKGDRNQVAQKLSQAICRGNQSMTLCLGLLEPRNAQDVLTGIFKNLSHCLDKFDHQNGLVGALESLEETRRKDRVVELEDENERLRRISK